MIIRIEWKEGGNVQGMFGIPNGTILCSGRSHSLNPNYRRRLQNKPDWIFWYIDETYSHIYGKTTQEALDRVQLEWPDITSIEVLPIHETPDWEHIEEWEDTHLVPFIKADYP